MRALLLAGLLLALPAVVVAQESPRAIIERAIVAHGGPQKLAAIKADKVRLKGTLHVGDTSLTFANESMLQLPAQFKSTVSIVEANRARTVVHLLDGDRATILLDGQPQPVAGVHLAQLQQTLNLEQALRLVPLLNDASFSLHALPEVKYNTRVFVGVMVRGKGQRELKLFFDKKSGLLVKAEHRLDGPGGKDVVQEAFYADYRDLGGYLRPGKVVVLRDGKKVMEAELIEAQRLDRIDPSEFTRP
jgi:hypothetical protein